MDDDEIRERMATKMFGTHQHWLLYLDWLDGLVTQTKERGFTEEQARGIVASAVGGAGTPPEQSL